MLTFTGWMCKSAWSQIPTDTLLANQYYQTADSLSKQGQYQESNALLRKARRIYQQAEHWEKYVACFNSIAHNLWPVATYDSAVIVAEQALRLSQQYLGVDHPEAARAYDVLGIVKLYAGKYPKALAYYQQAFQIRKKHYPDDHLQMANSYEFLGVTLYSMEAYDKALSYHQKALAVRQKAYTLIHPLLADSYYNIAGIYISKGSHDQALHYLQETLNVRRELFGQMHYSIASTYNEIGVVYRQKGAYDQALSYFQKALAIEKALLGEHPEVATVYYNIGSIYQQKKAYDQALTYYQKSLAIKKVFGDVHPSIVATYTRIGLTYKEKGAHDQSALYFQKALATARQIAEGANVQIAIIYNHLGVMYQEEKAYAQALSYFQKALAIKKALFGNTHPLVATSYQNIGSIYEKEGTHDQALNYYQQALTITEKAFGNVHPDKSNILNRIGNLYFQQQTYDSALSYYQQSLVANGVSLRDASQYAHPILAHYQDGNILLATLSHKAKALSKMKLDSVAYATYLVADSLLDQLRRIYQVRSDKISFNNTAKQLYDEAIQNALRRHRTTQDQQYLQMAFYFSEKSKAGVLTEALSTLEAKQFGRVPDSLLMLEAALKADRTFYQSQLAQDSSVYQAKLFTVNQQYDSLVQVLEGQFPDYYQLKYAPRIVTVPVVQSQLSSDEAVISYFVGDSTQYAFAITADRFQVITLPTDTSLNQRIQTLRQVLHSNKTSPKEYQRQALALYQQLLAPVIDDSLLTNINRLTIIPDGALGYLPFELLLTQPPTAQADYTTLPYLMRDYTVRYGYSATWLFHPFSRPKSSAAHQYIAFAPSYPTSTLDSTQQLALGQFRDQVTPLLWNQQEAQSIGQYLPGVAYTQQAAVERRFKEEVNQYGIIHLAMHALVDDQNPMYSRLVFASDATDTLEDSYLNAYELYDMELSADLAVLSACETGYGKLEQGEGIMSLARAFAYAGCPSIVMSHWLVDDASSARLMDHFYRYIAEGLPKDEALRQAKLAYLETASVQKAHPFFWSNFVLIGDAAPIVTSSVGFSGWLYAIGSTLLLLGLVVGVYWYQRRRTALG